MKILCVLNPTAGGGRIIKRVLSEIHTTFQKPEIIYDIVTTEKKGDGTAFSKKAVEEGYTVVVAIGGDGTVNEVATGLVGTPVALGVIPVGSGNGLARGLRIPLSFKEACKLIIFGQTKKIDVGRICNRYFFVTSGVGFDAYIGKCYDEKVERSRGVLPYFRFAVIEFFKYTPQEIQVRYDQEIFTYSPLVLTVANLEQYGGGAVIAPKAVPDDGLFDICVFPKLSVLKMLYYLPRLFLGRVDTIPEFKTYKTNALTITRTTPGPAHVDGEPFIAGESLEYTLLPRALNVRVPISV